MRIKKRDVKETGMEIYFPHLTNGIAKAPPSKRHRARAARKMWLIAGFCGSLILSIGFAFASTMNQEMIAQEEKLQVQVCHELQFDINRVMYGLFIMEEISDIGLERVKFLESLTASYSNYCKI